MTTLLGTARFSPSSLQDERLQSNGVTSSGFYGWSLGRQSRSVNLKDGLLSAERGGALSEQTHLHDALQHLAAQGRVTLQGTEVQVPPRVGNEEAQGSVPVDILALPNFFDEGRANSNSDSSEGVDTDVQILMAYLRAQSLRSASNHAAEGSTRRRSDEGLRDKVFAMVQPLDWTAELPQQEGSGAVLPRLPGLHCDLYPYQRRALAWLTWREELGAATGAPRTVDPGSSRIAAQATHSPSWQPMALPGRETIYHNPLTGRVRRTPAPADAAEAPVAGGILADEMGLGKTVEIIALMLQRPRPSAAAIIDAPAHEQTEAGPGEAGPSGLAGYAGTLIVTPPTILQQWRNELARHSGLKVVVYPGLRTHREREAEEKKHLKQGVENLWQNQVDVANGTAQPSHDPAQESRDAVLSLQDADVVLTSYQVLQREVHYSPANRLLSSLRRPKKYPVPESPLLAVTWWRLVLDEAQMVGSAVSALADMAARLRGAHRWAVTGTPIGPHGLEDLHALLRFLRHRPFADARAWRAAIAAPFHQGDGEPLRRVLQPLMWRNSKAGVEVALPQRRLHSVRLGLPPAERAFYQEIRRAAMSARRKMQDHLAAMEAALRSDAPASPTLTAGQKRRRQSSAAKERHALEEVAAGQLLQLRLACIHPQLTRAWRDLSNELQLNRGGALSKAEIMQRMVDKAQNELQGAERQLCGALNALATALLRHAARLQNPDAFHDADQPSAAANTPRPRKRRKMEQSPAAAAHAAPGSPKSPTARKRAAGKEVAVSEEERSGEAASLRERALGVLEQSQRVGEKGIEAQHDLEIAAVDDISTADASLRAWRRIQVHTAKLLGDLYGALGRQREAEAARADMEGKLVDLLQAANDRVAAAGAKLDGLRARLGTTEAQLAADSVQAASQGWPAQLVRLDVEPWLEQLLAEFKGAQAAEEAARQQAEAEAEAQAQAAGGRAGPVVLLGTRVEALLRRHEDRLIPTRALLEKETARRLAPGQLSRLVDVASILKGLAPAASTIEDDGIPPTLAALAARSARQRQGGSEVELTAAVKGVEELARQKRAQLRRWERQGEAPAAALARIPDAALWPALSFLRYQVHLVRLLRDLHRAELTVEVEHHAREGAAAEARAAAEGGEEALLLAPDTPTAGGQAFQAQVAGLEKVVERAERAAQHARKLKTFNLSQLQELLQQQQQRQDAAPRPQLQTQPSAGNPSLTSPLQVQPRPPAAAPIAAPPPPPTLPTQRPSDAAPACQEATGGTQAAEHEAAQPSLQAIMPEEAGPSTPPLTTADTPRAAVSTDSMQPAAQPGANNATTANDTGPSSAAANGAEAAEGHAAEAEHRVGECAVCLSPIEGEMNLFTPCSHWFCTPCTRTMFGAAAAVPCPVCRTRVLRGQVFRAAIASNPTAGALQDGQDPLFPGLHKVHVAGEWSAKITSVVRRILWLRWRAPGEKALVFSQFHEALRLLKPALALNQVKAVMLEGGQKLEQEVELLTPQGASRAIEAFQEGEEAAVFLLPLRTAAAGLTLTRANHVFLLEPSLDPAIEQQAVGRVHRIGQLRDVTVIRFLMRDTVEEMVLATQEQRQALFETQAGEEGQSSAMLAPRQEVVQKDDVVRLLDAVVGQIIDSV